MNSNNIPAPLCTYCFVTITEKISVIDHKQRASENYEHITLYIKLLVPENHRDD